MSVNNNDVSAGGRDVVKTQLASAYEDGITGYGEFSPEPVPIEQQFIMKSTDPNDPNGPSYDQTSPTINDDRIQAMASLKIDPQELSRYKEVILARNVEDMLDESLAMLYFSTNASYYRDPENIEKIQSFVDQIKEEIKGCQELLIAFAVIQAGLSRFEQEIVKGTLIKSTDEMFRTQPSIVGEHVCPFKQENFDSAFHKLLSPSQNPFYEDVVKALHRTLGQAVATQRIHEMTTTAMLIQSLYDTEISIDYGVSPTFMVDVLGSLHGPREKTKTPGSSPVNETDSSIARHYTVKNYLHNSVFHQGALTRFVPASQLFGKISTRNFVAPHIFNELQSTEHQVMGKEHPVEHAIPRVISSMQPMDALTYLASLISNELTLSQGIVNVSRLIESDDSTQSHLKPFRLLKKGNERRSVKEEYEPIIKTGHRGIGKALIGASRVDKPVHSISTNSDMGMMNLLRRKVPIPGSTRSADFLPFEAVDKEMDIQDGVDRVGFSNTMRDTVLKPLLERPSDVSEISSLFSPMANQLKSEMTANFRVLSHITRRTLEPHSNQNTGAFNEMKTRNVLGRVIQEFGMMIKRASEYDITTGATHDTQSETSLYELVFLSKFLKPEGHAENDGYRRFCKKLFVSRACALALTNNSFLTSSSLMGNDVKDYDNESESFIKGANAALIPGFHSNFVDKVENRFRRANSSLGEYNNPLSNDYEISLENTFIGLGGERADGSTASRRRLEDVATAMARIQVKDSFNRSADDILQSADTDLIGSYPGVQARGTGSDLIDAIFGSGPGVNSSDQTGQFIKRIHAIVDIYLTQNFRHMGEHDGVDYADDAFPPISSRPESGRQTLAHGMDRSQLYSLIIEMFVILANEFLSAESVMPKHTATASDSSNSQSMLHNFLNLDSNTMQGYLRGRFGPYTATIDRRDVEYTTNSNHYHRLIPKIEEDATAPFQVWGTSSKKYINLEDLGRIMIALGNKMSTTKMLQETNAQAFWGGVKQNAQYGRGTGDALYYTGFRLGANTSLTKIHNAVIKCAQEDSAPAMNVMPAYSIMRKYRHTSALTLEQVDQAINFIEDGFEPSNVDIFGELTSKINEIPEKLQKFVPGMTYSQIFNAGVKLDSLARTFNSETFGQVHNGSWKSPFIADLRNSRLDRAAKLLIDDMTESNMRGKVLFYGIPKNLVRSRKVALASQSVDVDLREPKSLIYKISFQRNTELSSFVNFEQNFDVANKIIYDSNFKTTRRMIAEAVARPEVNTFEDLIDYCKFYYRSNKSSATASGATFLPIEDRPILSSITNKSWTSDQDLRDRIKTVLKSEILKYMFERITNLSISETDLTYSNSRIISRQRLIDTLKLGDVPPLVTNSNLSNEPEKIVDALFESDTSPQAETSEIQDPIKMIVNPEKFREAFQPILVRTGNEAKFEDPIATLRDLEIVQVACHSAFCSMGSIDEAIFTPTIFDEVIAVLKDDFLDPSAYTVTAPDLVGSEDPALQDSYNVLADQVGSHFGIEGDVSADNLEEYFKVSLNSPFRIDNYRPIFEIDLE